jgi:hypothetical protein
MNANVHMARRLGGSRRTGQARSAGQTRSVPWLRVRPGAPRTVLTAVGLMYAAAALELAALITIVATAGSVRSALLTAHPALWHTVRLHLTIDEVTAPIGLVLLLWLAWANGRGYDWARLVSVAFLALVTLGLLQAVAGHGLTYARADLIVGAVQWLVFLAAVVLIFARQSRPYYRPETAKR